MKKILLSALLLAAGAGAASAQSFETYISNETEEVINDKGLTEIVVRNYQLVPDGGTFQAAYEVEEDAVKTIAYIKFANKLAEETPIIMEVKPLKTESNAEELGTTLSFSTCIFGNCMMNTYEYSGTLEPNGETMGGWGEHSAFEPFFDSAEDAQKFSMDYQYEYTVVAHDETQKFVIKFQSPDVAGVDAVDVENGKAEYFNLQGLRVAQPEAGQLYIKRQGGKATKVVF